MYAQVFDKVESVLRTRIRRVKSSLELVLPRLDPAMARLISESLPRNREGLRLHLLTALPTNIETGVTRFVEASRLLSARGFEIRTISPPLSAYAIIDETMVVSLAGDPTGSGPGGFGLVLEGLDVVEGFAYRFVRWWESAEETDPAAIEAVAGAGGEVEEPGGLDRMAARLNEVAGIVTVTMRLFPKSREIKVGGKLSGLGSGEEESALRALFKPLIHHLPRFADLEVFRQKVHREKSRITHSTSLGFLIPVYRLPGWGRFFQRQLGEFRPAFRELVNRDYDLMLSEGKQALEGHLQRYFDRQSSSQTATLFKEDRDEWVETRMKQLLKRFPGQRSLAGDYMFMYRINGFHRLALGDESVRQELKPLLDDLAQRDLPLGTALKLEEDRG
ncbi:hypothetical protein ACFLT7_04580 [candidate division KSB1 bacterium]